MATSNNPYVQKLMDEVDALDENDIDIETKLNMIAEAMATAQGRVAPASAAVGDAPVDPADAFACDGCQ